MVADILNDDSKDKIVTIWKRMSEGDKAHFINQVALALSIWGSDRKGKRLVVEVLRFMTDDGTTTLADFGLYIEKLLEAKEASEVANEVKRASVIILGYRIKNSMSSEPHLSIV
jgi:hypothetical protein